MRILIIEDNELTAQALVAVLSSQNYAVEVVTDGQIGWELINTYPYDLLLLDVMLPKLDGISLCRQVRSHRYQLPILLLTGRDSGHDKAIGLDAGADDYVVKPFDAEELVARIRALLRRGRATTLPVLEWQKIRLDPTNCEVTYQNTVLSLTAKEYALLELFLRNQRRIFSCANILEHLWSYQEMPGEDAVRTHIKGLRQKLKAVNCPTDLIETVYGIGYRLKPLPSASHSTEPTQSLDKPLGEPRLESALAQISEPTRQQTLALLANAWNRYKFRVCDQIEVLRQTAIALLNQSLNQPLMQQARQEAHTLAGSLGTFGFSEGSRLARILEHLLRSPHLLHPDEAKYFNELVAALSQEIERSPTYPEQDIATSKKEQSLLLVVDNDQDLTQALVAEAIASDFRIEVAANLISAKVQVGLEPPSVVLLDPAISPTLTDSFSWIEELSQYDPAIPVVIYTAHTSLSERLAINQLGGHKLLAKTALPAEILEAMTQVLHQVDQEKARVLVVDDDPKVLTVVQTFLKPWGLKVTTLDNPQQFWHVLEASQPNLLILDIEMPGINGLELCQIIRSDLRWSRLPVLFLTAHTETETINQAFAVGADDFVSKPIAGPELVTRTLNRLERSKLLTKKC